MKKRYNIFIVSKLYLRQYYKFLINETNVRKVGDAYSLFMYSIKNLYKLDSCEYSPVIEKYGNKCIANLKETSNTPKNCDTFTFEEKVRLVSVCEGYISATGILSYNSLHKES